MTNTVLVLGARGRLGGAVAQAFAAAGWRVLAQRRAGGTVPSPAEGIEWVQAEAGDTAALLRAAKGARAVVHAMNPAYTAAAWRAQAPGLMQGAIDAAAALGAVLLFPGNVYNFGADMPALLSPDTPQRPSTRAGPACAWRWSSSSPKPWPPRGCRRPSSCARATSLAPGQGTWLDLVIVKQAAPGRDDLARPAGHAARLGLPAGSGPGLRARGRRARPRAGAVAVPALRRSHRHRARTGWPR
jgi:hypothetical protein